MDYTKRQATAIFNWLMSQVEHEFEIAEEAIANMTEILNSVERPEPSVATLTDERIAEIISEIDFRTMVTTSDVFYLIARAIERELLSK